MKICDIITKVKIILELKGKSKGEVINESFDLFRTEDRVNNILKIKDSVFEMGKLLSTGIGKSFAIPHCKTNAVEGIVAAFGKTIFPIEFDSIANKPVHLVLLIVSNENIIAEHLKLLSKIGNLINNDSFINKLLTVKLQKKL